MAFAAALTGGVALEQESKGTNKAQSETAKSLRANIKLLDALGFGGGIDKRAAHTHSNETRMVRHHTEASIFILLYNELAQNGRLKPLGNEGVTVGDMVVGTLGPATAPLRRVVEHILRLIDLGDVVTPGEPEHPKDATGRGKQPSGRFTPPKRGAPPTDVTMGQQHTPLGADNAPGTEAFRAMFNAVGEDLNRGGVWDLFVNREGWPTTVLTLDDQFVTNRVIELMHTSHFTVVGKVTQVWRDDEVVNLYRRSVLSIIPSLGPTIAFTVLAGMFSLANSVDFAAAYEAFASTANQELEAVPDALKGLVDKELVRALVPFLAGPAIQVLPLAICA